MFGLKELLAKLRVGLKPRTRMQDPKIPSRYDYTQGPMYYLGQQICVEMAKAGYPSKIVYGYRSAGLQNKLYAQGRTAEGPRVTNAKAWESPHNIYEAVDICHKFLGWKVEEEYWTTLAGVIQIIENRFGVKLRHGHDWDGDGIPVHLDPDERFRDSAHIELADWRKLPRRPMTPTDRWARFEEVLPEKACYLIASNRVPDGVNPQRIGKGHPKVGTYVRRRERKAWFRAE